MAGHVVVSLQAEDGVRDGHVAGVQTCPLPISALEHAPGAGVLPGGVVLGQRHDLHAARGVGCLHDQVVRSEEHTSELQSRGHLVCRLLLDKKKWKGRKKAVPSTLLCRYWLCQC